MSWLAMVASWRCNPCLIRDNDAMAAAVKANHGFRTRPSAKKKASDQEFARWQTRNPKIDILRSILNQIMQILNMTYDCDHSVEKLGAHINPIFGVIYLEGSSL